MTQKKRSLLPKFEVLIIFIFFIGFILWAMSQCNKTDDDMEDEPVETTTAETDQNADESNTASPPASSTTTTNAAPANSTTTTTPSVAAQNDYPKLFVTIPNLKLRTAPSLDSEVILKLKLHSRVFYLGEKSDSTITVNLGLKEATDYWRKVQHPRGKTGWVFGAGISIDKGKREGVSE